MKISLNWLREFVDFPKLSAEEIGNKITLHTAELEEVISQKEFFEGVVAGKLISVKLHADAEKLHIGQFDCGKFGKKQIVFGSVHPVAEGDIVPVALDGATLKTGVTIKNTTIRGEKSEGMVCSCHDLGMKEDRLFHFQPKDLGKTLPEICAEFGDDLFDIDNKSLTHRPDLWGHRGIAREFAAIFGEKMRDSKVLQPKLGHGEVPVRIETKNCRRFMSLKLSGVKVQPSDMASCVRLENLGIRAISNIVDTTNLVLLEFGQPMHAFDATKVSGKIIIRQAKKGEKLLALDGVEYSLEPTDMVVADEKKVLSIAGVMGGEESAVTSSTTEVILECANFDPAAIRKTSARLGLRSESSMRYEKSLDPEMCPVALFRAVELISKSCSGAKVDSQLTDEYPQKPKPKNISVSTAMIRARAGISISNSDIQKKLESLGFTVRVGRGKGDDDAMLEVSVPSFRATRDIEIPEDLVEEVVRLHGFENIPAMLPTLPVVAPTLNKIRKLEWMARDFFASQGFLEVYHYSFVSPIDATPENVSVLNASSDEHKFLRRTLISNLVRKLESELRTHEKINFFEIGRVFQSYTDQSQKLAAISAEMAGNDEQKFFCLKKSVVRFLDSLQIFPDSIEFKPYGAQRNALVHPFQSAEIFVLGQKIGDIAVLHPAKNPIRNACIVFFEMDIPLLQHVVHTELQRRKYIPISPFPALRRDLSIVLDNRVLVADIEKMARESAPSLAKIELFDEYKDAKKLGADLKNVAFHLEFRSSEKTLEDAEVEKQLSAIVKNLCKKYGAKLRFEFDQKRV